MPEEPYVRPKGVNAFPSDGFSLVVDGKLKTHYASADAALKRALELKTQFPAIQITVRDNSTSIRTAVETTDKAAE